MDRSWVMIKFSGFVNKLCHYWGSYDSSAHSLKTKGNKKFFMLGQFFFFNSYMTPLYLLIIVFPKFYPLTATWMAVCADVGPKCQNLFCLVSD